MLPSWASDAIKVLTPVIVMERGKEVADWSQPPASSVTVRGCDVQPGASTEEVAARQNVIIRHTVWAPPATVVGAHDAMEYDGTRYAVDGEPMRWKSPTGAVSHVQIYLIDWEG